jgi:hypothetical protein
MSPCRPYLSITVVVAGERGIFHFDATTADLQAEHTVLVERFCMWGIEWKKRTENNSYNL